MVGAHVWKNRLRIFSDFRSKVDRILGSNFEKILIENSIHFFAFLVPHFLGHGGLRRDCGSVNLLRFGPSPMPPDIRPRAQSMSICQASGLEFLTDPSIHQCMGVSSRDQPKVDLPNFYLCHTFSSWPDIRGRDRGSNAEIG